MTGKTNSEYIHPDKLKEIEESIDKCMFSKLVIDATEEAAYYGFEEAKYDGSLLSAEKMTIKMGGRRVAAYKILVEPLLYRYAKAGKQISAIDIKLLDTPVSKTNDIIVLQGFLLRKIEAMKSDRTADRIIHMMIFIKFSVLMNRKSEKSTPKNKKIYGYHAGILERRKVYY